MTINGPEGMYIPDYVQGAKTDAAKADAAYWRDRARAGRGTVERVVDVTDPRKLMQLKEDMQQIAAFEKGVIEFQNGIIDGALKRQLAIDRFAKSLQDYDQCVRMLCIAVLKRRTAFPASQTAPQDEKEKEFMDPWPDGAPTKDEKLAEEWGGELGGRYPTDMLRIAMAMPREAALSALAEANQ